MRHIEVDGYSFGFVCDLDIARDQSGAIQEFMPQSRYYKADALPLNNYGHGPFVKFKIARNLREAGVYVLTTCEIVKYVGEASNLADRYNMGYGNISPRNCFKGGQETNCRLNNLIYQQAKDGLSVSLWFHPTADYKRIESELRRSQRAEWNRI